MTLMLLVGKGEEERGRIFYPSTRDEIPSMCSAFKAEYGEPSFGYLEESGQGQEPSPEEKEAWGVPPSCRWE